MGYKRTRTIYKLVFEEPFEGLTVRARSMPLGEFLKLAPVLDMDIGAMTSEDTAKMERLFELFTGVLIEWNMEDENDQPVPATLEGLLSLEIPEALAIVNNYAINLGGISAPLEPTSTDGLPSQELGIPTEVVT